MRRAWVALGSNLGERRGNLEAALKWLRATPGVEVEALSAFRESAPMGPPQPDYLNGALRLVTGLSPMELLSLLQGIEDAMGRVRGERWGPRTLDLDILFIEDLICDSDELTIPHPGIAERRFVLEPLCDLDPNFIHPVLDRSLSDLLEALPAC